MLEEYAAISHGNVVYEFVNLLKMRKLSDRYYKRYSPFLINVEKGSGKTAKLIWAVIQHGDREEVLLLIL